MIVLGQEFAGPPDVRMSDEQVEFLEDRLAHWTARDKQVLVLTHFPLGDTVSASWIPWYHGHHEMNDRLTRILGNYPNAIVLSGHTHYPAELGDWAVQRRTTGGHADGFWAVNTTAMHVEWDAVGENTQGISEVVTRDVNRGLTVDAYRDRVVVTAHDFATDEQLRQVVIPNPLVASETVAAPAVEAGTPTIMSTHVNGIKPGAKLTVDEGEWTDGVEFGYQWLAGGEPIPGATRDALPPHRQVEGHLPQRPGDRHARRPRARDRRVGAGRRALTHPPRVAPPAPSAAGSRLPCSRRA